MAQIMLDVARPLPDNFVVDKAVVIIEGIDGDDDETTIWWTSSPGVKAWQSLGMLEAAVVIEKDWIAASYRESGLDDE